MGKDRTGQRTKGGAQATSAARAADFISNAAPLAFGGAFASPIGAGTSSSPKPVAGITLSAELEVENAVTGELKVTLKKLAKRDAVTRVKAVEELRAYLEGASTEELMVLLPAWPSLYGRLSTDVDRRAREQAGQAHLIVVQKVRKHVAPYLKDLAGPWVCAFFDSSKEAARCASEAWNDTFPTPLKRTDALDFVQPSILSHVATNLLEHTPETLSDARFVTQVEMEEKYARVVSASVKTIGYLARELSLEQRQKCSEDYQRMFGSSKFWALSTPPSPATVRRNMFDLISTLVDQWKETLGDRLETLAPVFPGKAFAEQDPSVHADMWQAVLLFTRAFPESWSISQTSKSKDKSVSSRFFTFLSRGCYGSAQISYPSLLPLLNFLSPSTAGGNFIEDFFTALWSGLSSSNVDRQGSSALVTSYAECVLLVAGRLAKAGSDENQTMVDSIVGKAVTRLAGGVLVPSSVPDAADKVISEPWGNATAKILSRISAGSTVGWEALKDTMEKGLTTSEQTVDVVGFCSRSRDLFTIIWTVVSQGETSPTLASLKQTTLRLLEICLAEIEQAQEDRAPALARLVATLFPLVKDDAGNGSAVSAFFAGPFQKALKSDVPFASMEPLVKLVSSEPDLAKEHWSGVLKLALVNLSGLRRLELVSSLLDIGPGTRDVLRSVEIPQQELDEYSEHLLLQRLGKVPLSGVSETLIGKVVSQSLAEGLLSGPSTERVCSFVAGWFAEFASTFLTVSNQGQHTVPSLSLHTAISLLEILRFVLSRRSASDWVPRSVRIPLFLDISDLASYSPATVDHLDFVVSVKNGSVNDDGMEMSSTLQRSAGSVATPLGQELEGESLSQELLSRWWATFSNLLHCGTPGQFAHQLSGFFALPGTSASVKSTWIKAALFDTVARRKLALVSDVSGSAWLKLGRDPVPRALQTAGETAGTRLEDTHGMSEYSRRIATIVEVVREIGIADLVALDLPEHSDEDDTPAVRLLLDLVDFSISQADSELGLLRLGSDEMAKEGAEAVLNVLIDHGRKPSSVFLVSAVSKPSMDPKDDLCTAALKSTLREAKKGNGAEQIRSCRRLRTLLIILKNKSFVAGKDSWTFFEAVEKSFKSGDVPLGVLLAAIDCAVSSSRDRFVAFQSQLMSQLGALDVTKVFAGNAKEVFELLVPLNVSFESSAANDGLPVPRIIFLLRQIVQWVDNEAVSDYSIAAQAELAALFANLSPLVADVDGAHWQFMLQRSIAWLREPASSPAFWSLRYRTYVLVKTLLDLSKSNPGIADALKASHRQLYAKLLASYLSEWKDAAGAQGSNKLEEDSRSLVAELCQHVPHDVLVPAGRFDDLCAMLASRVEWDQKTAAILLNRETIERIQGLALKIEMGSASAQDDGEGPKFLLPPALVQLASERPDFDLDLLSIDGGGAKLTEGLTHLLAWYALMSHFGDIPFQLKSAYLRHIRDTDNLLPGFLDYAFETLGVGVGGTRNFDLSLWDFTDFEMETFDPSSSISYRLLAAHLVWLIMRQMPTLVRLWWSDIRDKQLSMAIESYVERHFSPKIVSLEMDSVRHADSARFEKMDFRPRGTNEVVIEYNVEDSATLDLAIRFPSTYPLRPVEIDGGGGSRAGVQEGRWKSWILNITAVLLNQNGKVYDAVAVWHRNVTLHYQGVEECSICYSIVGVIDRSLPSKQCKTCKHKFHNACMAKWLKSSGQTACPLCRSEL